MNKHYLIVLNPLPNKQKKYWLNWLVTTLKQQQHSYYIFTTSAVLADNQLFFKQHLAEYTEVIMLGGDGTLHLLANCMAYSNKPITVLPCGTGNDFMRNFAYSKQQLKQLVQSERVITIDLGKVNARYFINSAGVGFDAEIVERTKGNKGWLARFSYLYHTLACLLFFKESLLSLKQQGKETHYKNFLTVFANGKYFGGGMKIAPNAELNSSHLIRYSVEKTHLAKKLWALPKLYYGKHVSLPEVKEHAFTQLEVLTPNLPVQADGESAGYTPVVIEVAKSALTIKII